MLWLCAAKDLDLKLGRSRRRRPRPVASSRAAPSLQLGQCCMSMSKTSFSSLARPSVLAGPPSGNSRRSEWPLQAMRSPDRPSLMGPRRLFDHAKNRPLPRFEPLLREQKAESPLSLRQRSSKLTL